MCMYGIAGKLADLALERFSKEDSGKLVAYNS